MVTDAPAGAAMGTEARIDSLDVLRGLGVLGILLMNIIGFGLPMSYTDPTVYGDFSGPNHVAWLITSMFFEGTMRGLFTLLFGAGVVLYTSRLEQAGVPNAADLHVRRMLWLIVFGFVNSHLLLWFGDILFEYGAVGLVLYAFRKLHPRILLPLAAILLGSVCIRGWIVVNGLEELRAQATDLTAQQASGKQLSASELETLEEWRDTLADMKPTQERLGEEVQQIRESYGSAFHVATDYARHTRTEFLYKWGFPESLGTMMLGVALFTWGALQGRWSNGRYAMLAIAGYSVGVVVNLLEARAQLASEFDPLVVHTVWFATYELGRIPMTLGHVGLVLLLWKSGWLAAPLRVLAAVGRMAFTNYLAQSLICLFLFTGAGLAWFGQLQRFQLYYVVAGIWILQMIWSPWWLRRYRYGPLEWLWRSLIHGKRQPWMRGPA